MRIANISRTSVIVFTATAAIVCGSWEGVSVVNSTVAAASTFKSAPGHAPDAAGNLGNLAISATQVSPAIAVPVTDAATPAARAPHLVRAVMSQPLQTEAPQIEIAKLEPPAPIRMDMPMSLPSDLLARPVAVAPPPVAKMGVFSSRRSPASRVRPSEITGEFGNGYGAAPRANHATVASIGSFGLAPDTRAGFAREVIGGTVPAARTPHSTQVSDAGFGNGNIGGKGVQLAPVNAEPAFTPPVVVSEQPARYSSEAQQAGIQGEVTLKVRLLASGQVQVIGVVNGLGHGLDEEARHVAESIHFKPALRNGQPVDHTTLVHVTFQLA